MNTVSGFSVPRARMARSAVWVLLACAMASGCRGPRIQPDAVAYVYVAENGMITFLAQPVRLSELPEALRDAGADERTPIMIKAQGDVSERLRNSIASALRRQGFARALFVSETKTSAYVVGEDGKPVPATPTPVPQPPPASP